MPQDNKKTEILYQDHIIKIARHLHPAREQNVIVHRIKIGSLNQSERALVEHHMQAATTVKSESVLHIVDYSMDEDYLSYMTDDYECIPLAKLIEHDAIDGKISIQKFLQLGIYLIDGLEAFHRANLVHRALSPFTIGYSQASGKVKILSCGIERHVTKEILCLHEPDFVRQVIPYISPEQTGRMNRTVDSRSDFYSFGVTLFELLTGTTPFVSDDPMEIVHSHIARRPDPSLVALDTIPKPILAVLFKLLEKTAEDRYQSCHGIKCDLLEISRNLGNATQLEGFTPGTQDRSTTFQIPEKIYGREGDIEALMEAYNCSRKGDPHVAMVCGAPGIGKTVLLNELHKPIVADRGHFISGKYDQYSKDQPYSAIIQAFSKLLRQCISDSEENIYEWIKGLGEKLRNSAQIIVDLLPDLELLIGPQPPVPKVGPIETQNRFFFYFANFVRVFSQKNHPLVLFLDDLQWADTSSLQLMERLLVDEELEHFLFLGSYRDNEVDESSPLMFLLKEIERSGKTLKTIKLQSIKTPDIQNLLADTLHMGSAEAKPLAEKIEKKTGGNPFFVREFIKTIHQEKNLAFDHGSGWTWDLESISRLSATDNVITLMTHRIQKYDDHSQKLLKIGACVGSKFNLEVIAHVAGTTIADLLSSFREPLNDSVIRIDEVAYFFHDRIYEAVYHLMNPAEKSRFHFAVGRYILDKMGEDGLGDQLIYVTDQLNSGISQIETEQERAQLAKLNLRAARKAKMSNAYQPAEGFLSIAWDLSGDHRWERDYALALALCNERAEVSYLRGNIEEMERNCHFVLSRATSNLDKVKAYEIQIRAHETRSNLQQAINLTLEISGLLGIKIPKNPKKYHLVWQLLKTKGLLRKKTLEDLQNIPVLADKEKSEANRILYLGGPAMYFAQKPLAVFCILKRIQIINTYGYCSTSAVTNASYALLLCGALREFQAGYKFGLLALKNLENESEKEFRGGVIFRFNSFVRFWAEPLETTMKPFIEAYHRCQESGDIAFMPYPTFVYAYTAMLLGKNIHEFLPNIAYMAKGIKQLKQENGLNYVNTFRQAIDNLLAKDGNPVLLKGKYFDETALEKRYKEDSNIAGLIGLHGMKSILGYLFDDLSVALNSVKKFYEYRDGGTSSYLESQIYFYDSLIRLAIMLKGDKNDTAKHLQSIRRSQKLLTKFAKSAPMNFENKRLLVEAELARFHGKNLKAVDFYNRSIKTALANGFANEAGMASERLADYYLSQDNSKYASFFLNDALKYYHRWGAARKVIHFVEKYGEYLDPTLAADILPAETEEEITYNTAGFDFASFQKTANTISGEIVLENLLAKLMTILLENAGAQKGCLLLYDKRNRLRLEAEANIQQEDPVLLRSVPMNSYNMIPHGVISYVARTGETAIFDSDSPDHNFQNDPYLTTYAPKSVLCAPIYNKGKMTGLIYLENNLAKDTFTKERVEILRALSGQIAIAIDNAILYGTLEKKNIELSDALTRAKISARVKNEFVANTSHELRTPLNAIINIPERIQAKFFETENVGLCNGCLAEFALDPEDVIDETTSCPSCNKSGEMVEIPSTQFTGDPARVLNLLEIVVGSGKHLMHIVDDILDVSKLEAGKMQLYAEEVNIAELVENVVITTKGLSVKHKVNVVNGTIAPDAALYVDKVKMSQILINLVGNAIKYSHENSQVEIEVEEQKSAITFIIRDHGVGISKEHQPIIFESFRQVDGGNTRAKGGTGLGLSITKKLVELHKGEIRLESEQGRGTTFWVDIPRRNQTLAGDAKKDSSRGAPKNETIMVIDDDLSVLESSALALSEIGYTPEILRDPSGALARITELQPKLIILDIMMPKVSGMTILQQIRENEQLRDRPVLVSSGYYSNREIVGEMGAHFIAKPWTAEELGQKINEILDQDSVTD